MLPSELSPATVEWGDAFFKLFKGIVAAMMKLYVKPVFFCFILLLCNTALAVMPPGHYSAKASDSRIKAVAVVKEVIILSETKEKTRKKIVFELEKGFEKNIPQIFTGNCCSVDHHWQSPLTGGRIYYYPVTGQRVLVTVSNNGGNITSLTTLHTDLEQEIDKNRLLNISFKMGKAQIVKNKDK